MGMYDVLADSLQRIYANEGTNQANLAIAKGNALARGQEQSGQMWGQTLGQLGGMVANLPGHIAQQQEAQQRMQITGMQMDAMKRAQLGEQQANAIIAGLPRNADGTFDTGSVMQRLAAAKVPTDSQERLVKSIDGLNGFITSWNKTRTDHAADLADFLLKQHKPDEPLTADTVHLGVAAAKSIGLANDDQEKQITNAIAQGGDPETILKGIRGQGSTYKAAQAKIAEEMNKPTKVGADEQLVIPATGAVVAHGGVARKTEAELAADAANPASPTAGQSAAALKMLKESKATGAEDDQKYEGIQQSLLLKKPVAPEDLAFAKAYEKRKLLGPEASAAAAADRQASTQAAQVAQQARAQGFAESQAGRKEYTDKVATPYQTALASAQTLRDTVSAAKSGNKVAANLQNLETAMAAIRAQGLNRINTTEIHVAADAGSLWDRVQSAFGKVVSGQPVDPSLQKDILQFADILEKSATLKYQRQRTSLTQVYPGSKLPDESATAPASAPAPAKNPFR